MTVGERRKEEQIPGYLCRKKMRQTRRLYRTKIICLFIFKKQQSITDTCFMSREMHIQITLKFHLIPVRMAKIHKNKWQHILARIQFIHFWWEWKLVQPPQKSLWSFLMRLKINLSQDSVIPQLGKYPKDSPSYDRDPCPSMFAAALFLLSRNWKQPKCV